MKTEEYYVFYTLKYHGVIVVWFRK